MESSEVKFGIDILENSYRPFSKKALAVEKLGFDSIWGAEAHGMDVLVKLTVASVKTKRVKLGTVILVPSLRNPVRLAKTISSLDHVSSGRFILGIGPGTSSTLEQEGVPSERRVSRMLEMIKVLKRLWTESAVNYEGRFYKIKSYPLRLKPVQKPHPPIWIAAHGHRMLRITALHADGWIGSPYPKTYKRRLAEIRRIAEEAGRDPTRIMPAFCVFTSIAPDHETAREFIEPYFPWARGKSFFGTPDECLREIEKMIESGTRYFILVPVAPNEKAFMDSLKLYAEKVVPYFREQKA